MENFIVHGVFTVCNLGGYEIMLSDCGEMAKIKIVYDNNKIEISDWLNIALMYDHDEDDWLPFIDPNGYNIPLNLVIRLS
tara:strand:- start:6838 stop:7077 length:240 start_codon:yes stop_codon:yes gene_type:complete